MSSGPGFVTTGMNLPLKRVNVISRFAADLAGTGSFYQEVLGVPLTFEDETAVVFVDDVDAAPTALAKPRTI
jgi:catechol 2,3-dioxygenase-like lactoylglutathione lyase family enzyme